MSASLPPDWLSAYLDDELPPEQRAEADAVLAESESLRAELAELMRVSAVLRGLPAPESAIDFADRFAGTVGVETTAVSSERKEADEPAAPFVRPATPMSRAIGVVAGLASITALVLVAAVFLDRDEGPAEVAQTAGMAPAELADEMMAGEPAGPDVAMAEDMASPAVADEEPLALRSAGGDPFANLSTLPMAPAPIAQLEREVAADAIEVIEWEVDDVAGAIGTLQSNLRVAGVPTNDSPPPTAADEVTRDYFEVVYVEADPQTLATVLGRIPLLNTAAAEQGLEVAIANGLQNPQLFAAQPAAGSIGDDNTNDFGTGDFGAIVDPLAVDRIAVGGLDAAKPSAKSTRRDSDNVRESGGRPGNLGVDEPREPRSVDRADGAAGRAAKSAAPGMVPPKPASPGRAAAAERVMPSATGQAVPQEKAEATPSTAGPSLFANNAFYYQVPQGVIEQNSGRQVSRRAGNRFLPADVLMQNVMQPAVPQKVMIVVRGREAASSTRPAGQPATTE